MKAHQDAASTIHNLTVHNFPQSNGVAKHANCTIVEGVCTTMIASCLWAEAKHHMVWLQNQTLTHAISNNTMPYQMAMRCKPDILQVYEWGAHGYVKLHNAGKSDLKVGEEKFIGLTMNQGGIGYTGLGNIRSQLKEMFILIMKQLSTWIMSRSRGCGAYLSIWTVTRL